MSEAEVQEHDAEELLGQLNTLVGELEQYPDAEVKEKALDLVQIILKLHGEALRRMLAIFDSLPLKEQVHARMSADEVIRAILLIHGLLPAELGVRVAQTIDELRPFLLSQGCDVKLLGVEDGRARLRLMRSGKGAPPVAALKLEIEKALDVAAPDLLGIDIEGMAEQIEATVHAAALLGSIIAPARGETATPKLVQIKRPRPAVAGVGGTWVSVVRALGFEDGQFKVINYAEINLLVCKLDGEFYAFRNSCAAQPEGRSLDDALFDSPMLTCSCHGYSYNLTRGGVCVERPDLRLQSLPSKVEDDKVKVALTQEGYNAGARKR